MSEKTIQEQIDDLDAEIQRIETMTLDVTFLPINQETTRELALKNLREKKAALVAQLP
tara:strand:+ start:225 stop:398 length:174 start_codon:yes stop_codon:yes gene_type:complete